jgi:hydroxyethylthiazole kinase-like uncharacterized protein yjeF
MNLFLSSQIKEIDNYTIENEPVSSIELMERAARKLFDWVVRHFNRTTRIIIFAGPGNNGADGLALARLLAGSDFQVEVLYVSFTENRTEEWDINFKRLSGYKNLKFFDLKEENHFPMVFSDDLIIDAIFGSGLNRAIEGFPSLVINRINLTGCRVLSIDIPSGLSGEDNKTNIDNNIVRADYTVTFQIPKISFFFPENEKYAGKWEVVPIGLHPVALRETKTPFHFLETGDIEPLLIKRGKFSHKGTYGHGLMVAGSYGKFGAAVLSCKAALRTGIGLITCHIPTSGNEILQISVPEAIVQFDNSPYTISNITNTEKYDAIGIGPGIGTDEVTQKAVANFISECKLPLVIDADAINILALNKELLTHLPEGTILTPHPLEFERLVGSSTDSWTRLQLQMDFSVKYKCIVILKGAYTSVSMADGRVYFNSTGNPGMATAGSGDVLTGILLSLISQGYSPENASVTGVYLHGLAGDICSGKSGYESLIANDIINNIPNAFSVIRGLKGDY